MTMKMTMTMAMKMTIKMTMTNDDVPACQGVNRGHQSSGGERKKLLEEAKALANEDKLPEN